MLNRDNIRHGAILKPQVSKCVSVAETGRHAFVKTAQGIIQCVGCGTIKTKKGHNNVLHQHKQHLVFPPEITNR